MRLICPNCDAQYEIDDSVIPPNGRDVQCSNCGHAWFELGAAGAAPGEPEPNEGAAASDGAETTEPATVEPEPVTEPPEEPGAEVVTEPEPDEVLVEAEPERPPVIAQETVPEPAESGNEAEWLDPEDFDAPAEDPDAARPAPGEPERQTLDEAVVNVLREEAERETRARRTEGLLPIETQPELGLAAAAVAGAVAATGRDASADRVAHLDSDEPPVAEDDGQRGSRRALLPDIEEINSTLSASSARTADGELPPTSADIAQRRSGFRRGFSIALIVMILLLGTYVLAPNIATRIPATEPMLRGYVTQVDRLRMWMDDVIRSTTEALRGDEDEAAEGAEAP